MKKLFLLIIGLVTLTTQAQTVKAGFTAQEATETYYLSYFEDNLADWTRDTTNTSYTWRTMLNSTAKTTFQELVDPTVTTAAYIQNNKNWQDETLTSQEFEIREGSKAEWYIYFNPSKLDSSTVTFKAIVGETETLLFDARTWYAEHSDYQYETWAKLTFDLNEYVGQTVKFSFNYQGRNGGQVFLNGFKLYQAELEGITAKVKLGEAVHFINTSTGDGLTYAWQFDGGSPATSNEENPIVTYNAIGTYPVTLTVTGADGTDTQTINGFVEVQYKTPQAKGVVAQRGYLTATANSLFVPDGTTVQLLDQSSNYPQYWSWEVLVKSASEPTYTSSEQNPSFTLYDTSAKKNGTWYQFNLIAGNDAGETTFKSSNQAIAVGGSQYVWNQENSSSTTFATPYIDNNPENGYYGANTMGITRFAERFDAPLDSVALTQVALFLGKKEPFRAFGEIKVYIAAADKDGNPGPMVGPISKAGGDLVKASKYTATQGVKFDFSTNPVLLDHPFFVVVEGFGEYAEGTNEVAMAADIRPEGSTKSTTWFYKDDQWQQSTTPVSLGLFAHLSHTADNLSKAIPIPDAYHPIVGDVDSDGKVDVTDVNIVINIMLGKTNAADYPNANVDGQDGIDVTDVNMVINIMLGK